MSSPLREKIESVNTRVQSLLAETKRALAGQCEFGLEQVTTLSALIEGMEPVMARAAEFRRSEPEIATSLDEYKAHLAELQTALDQVRVMLLAKRQQTVAGRIQLNAVKHWANAFSRHAEVTPRKLL